MAQAERRLSEFLTTKIAAQAGLLERQGDGDPIISSLEYDSRRIKPGALFFALPGLHTDGHAFIGKAVGRGAVAVVHEAEVSRKKPGVVYLRVSNSRYAMSPLAAAFYNNPSRRLVVTGVTGTEGKSTTVYLTWQLLRLLGKKAGFISTVQHSDGGEAQETCEHQTTPEAPVVQRMLREMADNGCGYAVIEASSHGLSPRTNRLGDVEFDAAVFTNIHHEHLEFHGSWEQYRDDKANLFRALDKQTKKGKIESFGVLCADDKNAEYFAHATKRRTYGFSVKGKEADLTLKMYENSTYGNWYHVLLADEKSTIDIRDQLPGAFNTGNVLAALLTVSGLTGLPVKDIVPLCPRLKPLRGRMTTIDTGQPFEVMVDYAHTPSSFQAIFPPLREQLDKKGGRIICLFGSAGERDTAKRGEQGKIAAAYSNCIVLADEDPRGEDPMAILEEIAIGIKTHGFAVPGKENPAKFKRNKNLFLIPDRPTAIRKALSIARRGDLVLLLGKGHENSIIYADHVMPYDEISEVEKALEEIKF